LEAGSQNLERYPGRFHRGLRSNGARNRMLGYPSHKVRAVPDFVGPFEEVGCGPPPNRSVQVAEQPGEVAEIGCCAWPLSPGRDQDESSISSVEIGFRLTSSKVSASCAVVQLNNVASFASCRGPFPRARMNVASRSQPSMVPIQYVSDENPSAISVFGNHTTLSSSSWMSMPTSPIRAAVCICTME